MQNRPDWEVQCEGLLQALPPEMEPICDSRGEVKDKIFVCIKGGRHDGHTDAAGVLRRGAAAIVTQKKLGLPREYTVPDTRAALARLCARYWGEPARELRLIGITGTNGKTTTAHLLCHLLQSAGIKTGRIGTDGIAWREKTQPNPYTTPPPTELHRILYQMVEDGITTVVMEVSSQALEQRRVEGITFAAAVFTNLSPEHLDYHGDMERYFASKAKIFSQCRCAVINTADPYGRRLLDRANVPISGYHLPWQYRCEPGRSILPWRGGPLIVPLTGEVFLPDALAAAETALVLGLTSRQVMAAMPQCPPVPGRAELLWQGMGRTILRDYAHTPDALTNVLKTLAHARFNRIITVFGCGGDRDRTKRAPMGRAVAELSDIAIVTSDNPRTEDPELIIDDIMPGLEGAKEVHRESDRRKALELAVSLLRPGDALLVAGEGHENYQIIGTVKHHFSDQEILKELVSC